MNLWLCLACLGLAATAAGLTDSVAAQASRPAPRSTDSDAPPESVPGARLLEGFEDVRTLRGQGQLIAVTEGAGVTQGQAALQIPPQGAVTVNLMGHDLDRPWWLKLDTLNMQPEPLTLRLEFSGGVTAQISAVVQPGKDTLAMPLMLPQQIAGWEWDESSRPVLTIRNTSESPIVVDNLRVESPVEWPRDTRAYDVGARFCWPGFSRDTDRDLGLWGNMLNPNYPHPLIGHTLGPWPDYRTTTRFQMTGSSKGQTVGYLWLSHVSINNMQPVEHYAKLNGKFLVNKKHQPRSMMATDGKRGLMIGMNGEWTADWFDKTYAPTFYDVVPIVLNAGMNELELLNTQVSAVVLAPSTEKAALSKAVERVEKDLSTYRRQFMVGRRVEPTCAFAATEAEGRGGLILLPADDASFSPTWQPTEEKRLDKLSVTTFAGATAVLELAVVPLKKGVISVAPVPFRSAASEGGKTLVLSRPAEVLFASRLPRIADASAYMQPWVLRPRVASAREREIIPAALVLSIAPNASEGTYSGQIKFTSTGGTCTLPVEVTVRAIGLPSSTPTFGVSGTTTAREVYGPVSGTMAVAEQDRLTREVRAELLKMGFNAFAFPASGLNRDRDMTPSDDACLQALRTFGNKTAGVGVGDLSNARSTLMSRYDRGLNNNYIRGLSGAIARTNDLARKAGMTTAPLYHAGTIWSDRDMTTVLADGEYIQSAKGRSVAFVPGYVMQARSENDLKRFRDSFSALVVGAGYPVSAKLDAFVQPAAGQTSTREVFLEFYTPDVYMMGFYAFGMGVQGWYCTGLHMRPGPYSGWGFGSPGYLVPEPELGQLSPTVAVLRARQGQSDFLLVRRADEVMEQARKSNVDPGELPALLKAIRDKARSQGYIAPDRIDMRARVMTPQELTDLRHQLIAATAEVLKSMAKK